MILFYSLITFSLPNSMTEIIYIPEMVAIAEMILLSLMQENTSSSYLFRPLFYTIAFTKYYFNSSFFLDILAFVA